MAICTLQLNKSTLGHFNKYQVAPKRMLQEFRVTEDAILPVGTDVGSGHFVAGQYVDVCGTT
jgi:large subunit ribosomal protein L3